VNVTGPPLQRSDGDLFIPDILVILYVTDFLHYVTHLLLVFACK